jgi:hypothetical protein
MGGGAGNKFKYFRKVFFFASTKGCTRKQKPFSIRQTGDKKSIFIGIHLLLINCCPQLNFFMEEAATFFVFD